MSKNPTIRGVAPLHRNVRYWAKNPSGGHYKLMTAEEIIDLPVQKLVDPAGCVMFLWCPYRHLPLGLRVIESWGFTLKTIGFIWVKITKHATARSKAEQERFYVAKGEDLFKLVTGPGFYTKSNTEPCFVATCGRVPIPTAGNVHSVIFAPRGRHSEKPYEAYKRMGRLYPDLSRVELFARRKMKGWDLWGNEVTSDVVL